MWSAWLRLRPPQVSRKLLVITISGRCRRTTSRDRAAQRDAVLQDPVGQAEELDLVDADDPRRLDLLGLAHPRHSSGSIPSMPASPLVTMQ